MLKSKFIRIISWTLVVLFFTASFSLGGISVANASQDPDPSTLAGLFERIGKAVDNLSDGERQKLVQLEQAVNDAETMEDLREALDDAGLTDKFEDVLNTDISLEKAQLTLKLIIAVMNGDLNEYRTLLDDLKDKYSSVKEKLNNNNITEKMVYDLVLDIDAQLRTQKLAEANYEVKLVQTVQVLANSGSYDAVKAVMIKGYNRLPVRIFGDETELFNTDNAQAIVNLLNLHVDEVSNPDFAFVKDTYDMAKQIFELLYLTKQPSSGGGGSPSSPSTQPKTFDDIQGHWAQADIEYLVSLGIIKGISEKQFAPELKVTRAQFVTLLGLTLKLSDQSDISFKDVSESSWYYSAVAKAVKAGIVSGYSDGTFQPDRNITREEMAVMLKKALDVAGKSTSLNGGSELLERYVDRDEVSSWAKDAMAAVVEAEIITGRSEVQLVPQGLTTRAEAAVVIRKVLNLM